MRSGKHGGTGIEGLHDPPAGPAPQAFDREWLWRAGLLLALYLVFVWPIIRADYAYIDDKGRALLLYLGWTVNGRPLADAVAMLVGWSDQAFDLAPLYQLLAVATLAMAAAWTSRAAGLSRGNAVLCFGLLICNPFFLENLSYRYDALGMALAIAAALLPFASATDMGAFRRSILLCGTTVVALAFYQPAINLCLILVLYLAMMRSGRGRVAHSLISLGRDLAGIAAGMLLYSALARSLIRGPYAGQRQALIEDLPAINANIAAFAAAATESLFGSPQGSLLGLALLAGAVAFVAVAIRGHREVGLRLALSLLLLAGMVLGVAGPMLLLAQPVLDNRVMMGFGMLAACLTSSLVFLAASVKAERICQGFLGIVLAGQVVLAFVYGNVLATQGRFEAALARQAAEDVFAAAGHAGRALAIKGSASLAPQARRTLDQLPGLRLLIRSPFDGEWLWGGVMLYSHGLPFSVEVANTDNRLMHRSDVAAALASVCRGRVAARRLHYDLVEVDGILILDFDRACR